MSSVAPGPHSVSEPMGVARVGSLARRYVGVLLAIAALIGIDQAVIQPLLLQVSTFAPTINLAGRQRMLSQKLAKESLQLLRTSDPTEQQSLRKQAQETLQTWTQAHALLESGGQGSGIAAARFDETADLWPPLEQHFTALRDAVLQLVQADAPDPKQVDALLAHATGFLERMDEIVNRLEQRANRQVRWLRGMALAIALSVIGLMIGLNWLVIRPAVATIRHQMDHLEARVAERTQALVTANQSLAEEIQQRHSAQLKTQQLQQELAHASRVSSLGRLMAGLAHELNHPLATIVNYAHACRASGEQTPVASEQVTQYLGEIEAAADRAAELVRQMRDFVRSQPAQFQTVQLRRVVEEVLTLLRHECQESGVRLAVESSGEVTLQADPLAVRQVLFNLVQNAIHSLDRVSQTERRLWIQLQADSQQAEVRVSDNGPGWGAKSFEELFHPFFTTKEEGLGLGLSICRSLVERHGGRIWAEQPPAGGALFVVVLPLEPPKHVLQVTPSREFEGEIA